MDNYNDKTFDIFAQLHYDGQKKNLDAFNENLLYGNRNESLVPYLIKILKDYECTGYIKYIGHRLIEDESVIDSDNHELYKYTKKSGDSNPLADTMGMYESRYNLLETDFRITYGDGEKDVTISLLLPKPYKKYYYMINGNKLYPIYQVVENSTYERGGNTVVMKTLRSPISLTKSMIEMEDTSGHVWNLTTVIIYLSKKLNPILYFLAKFGLEETLYFMNLADVISISTEDICDDKIVSFKLTQKLFMLVDKAWLDDEFVQIIVTLLKTAFVGRVNTNILDKTHWVRRLGAVFTNTASSQQDKGYSVLSSFEVALDGVTKETLVLDDRDRQDTYCLVRWMLMNFNELLNKDNLDIANKRIRLAEYIAAELAVHVSRNLYRLLGYSNKELKMKTLEGILNINPMFLIFKIQSSPLLRYDNSVNDMSCWNPLRYTFKGFSAMGGNSGRISDEFRRIHTSHMGRLDLDSSSNTDPGTTGIICPMADMSGKYFDDNYTEPDKKYDELIERYMDAKELPVSKYNIRQSIESAFSEDQSKPILKTVVELHRLSNNLTYEFLETFKNKDKAVVIRKTSKTTFKIIPRDKMTEANCVVTRIKKTINPVITLTKKPRR